MVPGLLAEWLAYNRHRKIQPPIRVRPPSFREFVREREGIIYGGNMDVRPFCISYFRASLRHAIDRRRGRRPCNHLWRGCWCVGRPTYLAHLSHSAGIGSRGFNVYKSRAVLNIAVLDHVIIGSSVSIEH